MGVIAKDIGQYVKGVYGGASSTTGAPILIIADSTTDAVERTGATVDRLTSNGTALSAVVLIPYLATLSENETISFTVKIKDSADGSSWSNETTLQAATVADTGGAGGSNEGGIVDINVDLSTYRRYVQFNVTCDLSEADIPEVEDPPTPAVEADDTAHYTVAVVLGGFKSFAV